jgi:hypothetical protein
VVADFEGLLHFLDIEKGELSARIGSGGEKVSNPPVVVGDEVLVINDEGSLAAFRIRAQATARAPQEPAAETPETPPTPQT